MADFVTLSCPSCGGRLQIAQDIEQFACAYCGREHIVKRSGGIVSLSPVVEALKKVEVGVDKTAAELAIVRLQKEIADLAGHRNSLLADSPRPQINGGWVIVIFAGAGLALYAMFLRSVEWTILGIVIGLIGLVPFLTVPSNAKHWDENMGVQIESLDRELAAKNLELQHYRNIVSR